MFLVSFFFTLHCYGEQRAEDRLRNFLLICDSSNVMSKSYHTYRKNLIITLVFISIISFCKEGGGHLLETTVFENRRKNFEIFKFSS